MYLLYYLFPILHSLFLAYSMFLSQLVCQFAFTVRSISSECHTIPLYCCAMTLKVLKLVDSFPPELALRQAQLALRCGAAALCHAASRPCVWSFGVVTWFNLGGVGGVGGGVGGTFGPQDSSSPSPEHVWRGVWHIKEPLPAAAPARRVPAARLQAHSRITSHLPQDDDRLCPQAMAVAKSLEEFSIFEILSSLSVCP